LICQVRQIRDFASEIAKRGIDLNRLYDPLELGEIVEFTDSEDERFATETFGRKERVYKRLGQDVRAPANQFPASFLRAGVTPAETKRRRNKFRRPHRAEMERKRRAEIASKAAETASALSFRERAIYDQCEMWKSIAQLSRSLRKHVAFHAIKSPAALRTILHRNIKKLQHAGRLQINDRQTRNGVKMILLKRIL
jgi:hypothetical protein